MTAHTNICNTGQQNEAYIWGEIVIFNIIIVHMYTYKHHTYIHTYIHHYMYIHTYIHVSLYIYIYIHYALYIHTYINTDIIIYTYIHTYIHYIYTYIHIDIIIYTYIHTYNTYILTYIYTISTLVFSTWKKKYIYTYIIYNLIAM